ncbi:hypothetical protein EYF80_008152 [Liparis tanakae]|uniref:Uncharacterized protein n=1 Tax=Liparis tanakae TaxID=230148 RepID=A0A4Z2IV14_9TELE|nr:hypothetical protein EYF80_008152 [Liparis tanakae]
MVPYTHAQLGVHAEQSPQHEQKGQELKKDQNSYKDTKRNFIIIIITVIIIIIIVIIMGGIPAGGIYALHPVPETLRFTEKRPVRNTAELNNNMDPYSLTTGVTSPPPNLHCLKTQSREKSLDSSPSGLGLSRSPVTCPAALPDTRGHQIVNLPPHQATET